MTAAAIVTFALAGVITYGWRASFLALRDPHAALPPWLRRSLRHVPAAVLSALVLPAFVRHTGTLDLWDARVLAGIVGGVVAYRTRSILGTIVAGMAVLLAANLLT